MKITKSSMIAISIHFEVKLGPNKPLNMSNQEDIVIVQRSQ